MTITIFPQIITPNFNEPIIANNLDELTQKIHQEATRLNTTITTTPTPNNLQEWATQTTAQLWNIPPTKITITGLPQHPKIQRLHDLVEQLDTMEQLMQERDDLIRELINENIITRTQVSNIVGLTYARVAHIVTRRKHPTKKK